MEELYSVNRLQTNKTLNSLRVSKESFDKIYLFVRNQCHMWPSHGAKETHVIADVARVQDLLIVQQKGPGTGIAVIFQNEMTCRDA